MSQRDRTKMSQEEIVAFIAEEKVVTCASIGPNGRPHLMPLWYLPDGDRILVATYGTSQKVVNLRRDPHATLQIEAGDTYDQLRGVMIEADVEIVEDLERVIDTGLRVGMRYAPPEIAALPEPPAPMRQFVEKQAPKRVVLIFTPTRVASWDHRKL